MFFFFCVCVFILACVCFFVFFFHVRNIHEHKRILSPKTKGKLIICSSFQERKKSGINTSYTGSSQECKSESLSAQNSHFQAEIPDIPAYHNSSNARKMSCFHSQRALN